MASHEMRQSAVEMTCFFFELSGRHVDWDAVITGGHPHKAQDFAQSRARGAACKTGLSDHQCAGVDERNAGFGLKLQDRIGRMT